MNINSLLKRESIEVIRALKENEVNTICKDISIKLCLAFPEHNLNRFNLIDSFSSINMYIAKMPKDSSGAKYLFENNSIYFNKELAFEEIPDVAMHECIHFLQSNNLKNKSFIYSNVAINEAAVQLMASEANLANYTTEKYFDIFIKTNSSNYYPLECTLLKQLTAFTGVYPLYSNIFNNPGLFEHIVSLKFGRSFYKNFSKQLDKLLSLENLLNCYLAELEYTTKPNAIKSLNSLIDSVKIKISKKFFDIQDSTIKNCFYTELNNAKTLDDLYTFKYSLYNFKNYIGFNDNYEFYNNFYREIMQIYDIKKSQINKFGELNLYENTETALSVITPSRNVVAFVKIFVKKLGKLFGNKDLYKARD